MRRVHTTERIYAHTFFAQKDGAQQQVHAYQGAIAEQDRRLPLGIHSSGVSRWTAGDRFDWSSTLLSLNLITAGDAEYEQGGRRGSAAAGDIVLTHAASRHGLATGPAGFMHHRFVRIEGRAVETLLRLSGLSDIDCLRPTCPARVLALMREAHRLMVRKPPEYYPQTSRLAYALIVECALASPQDAPGSLTRALGFIHANSNRPLTLREIARAAQVSCRTCSRIFAGRFDCSPVRFAASCRMKVAAEMLTGTTLSAKQIGAAVGYRDPSHFTLAFRKQFGTSPQKFRVDSQRSAKKDWD